MSKKLLALTLTTFAVAGANLVLAHCGGSHGKSYHATTTQQEARLPKVGTGSLESNQNPQHSAGSAGQDFRPAGQGLMRSTLSRDAGSRSTSLLPDSKFTAD
jgi:hypothetical protein